MRASITPEAYHWWCCVGYPFEQPGRLWRIPIKSLSSNENPTKEVTGEGPERCFGSLDSYHGSARGSCFERQKKVSLTAQAARLVGHETREWSRVSPLNEEFQRTVFCDSSAQSPSACRPCPPTSFCGWQSRLLESRGAAIVLVPNYSAAVNSGCASTFFLGLRVSPDPEITASETFLTIRNHSLSRNSEGSRVKMLG